MANPKRIEFSVLEHFSNMKTKKAYENRLFLFKCYFAGFIPQLLQSAMCR